MISLCLCNALQNICTFFTCHLQVGRSAGPIPPLLFTVGDVVKQTAQRTCTPQHLPKTHLRCKRGIWGLHSMHCRKDKGIAEIPVVQTTFLEVYCGSEVENTNTRVYRALLACDTGSTQLLAQASAGSSGSRGRGLLSFEHTGWSCCS